MHLQTSRKLVARRCHHIDVECGRRGEYFYGVEGLAGSDWRGFVGGCEEEGDVVGVEVEGLQASPSGPGYAHSHAGNAPPLGKPRALHTVIKVHPKRHLTQQTHAQHTPLIPADPPTATPGTRRAPTIHDSRAGQAALD